MRGLVPTTNIREFIVDEFGRSRAPLSLDEVAAKFGLDVPAVKKHLLRGERLSDARGLTPEKVAKVIEFYGRGVIFSDVIERLAEEFEASEAKLKDLDDRFGGKK
jgi:hypothetical protein